MPTQLTQTAQHPPGTAAFKVAGPAAAQLADLGAVEIAIVQPGPTERYLDPRNPDDPWSTSVYRFRPLAPRRDGAAVLLEIDYGVSYHLRANQPYKLRLRHDGGTDIDEVFTVPAALRRPTTRPQGWTPPPDPKGPMSVPAALPDLPPAPPPAPAPVAPPPVLPVYESEPVPAVDETPLLPPAAEPPKTGGRKWIVPVAVLLLLAAAGGAAFVLLPADSGPTMTMDACRKDVAAGPDPAAARAKAEALATDGQLLDCQFLLYKYAGEKGDRDAARVLGGWYDPDTWAKDKSPLPAPNPQEAARWHKAAAEAGDAESQYRYGMLLKLGRTDAADGPEQAQVWLRKAADGGHALAKDALAK